MANKDSGWNAIVNFFFESVLPWALLGTMTFLCGFIWNSNNIQTAVNIKLENILKNEARMEQKVDRIEVTVYKLQTDVAVLQK